MSAQWKSFEHLDGDTSTQDVEFVEAPTSIVENVVSRRGFMTVMSAAMALTAAACRRPDQRLVPAVKSVQGMIPGLPVEYSTVYSKRNVAYGAWIKVREGRPIKVKGNEQHPSNHGRTSSEMQATLLSLYDPDRIRRPRVRIGGGSTSYDNAITRISEGVTEAQSNGKKAVFVVAEHASPSYDALMKQISAANPTVTFVTMPSIVNDSNAQATKAAFGIDGEIVPDLSKARVVVCADADPLGTDVLALHHTQRWAQMRKPSPKSPAMSKLYVAEAQYSLTGANADVRVRMHPSQMESYLAAIESEIAGSTSVGTDLAAQATADTKKAASAAAQALKSAAGESVVLAGPHLSPRAHAIALNINNSLGNIGAGKALDPAGMLPYSNAKGDAINALVADLEAGNVHALVFCDVNPEYNGSHAFRSALVKAPFRAAVNLYEDETATSCDISIPATHWLESWGDAVAFDGSMSVQQPIIAPMNDGIMSTQDTLIRMMKKLDATFLAETETYADYVKNRWYATLSASNKDEAWRKTLQEGVVAPTSPSTASVSGFNTAACVALPVSAAVSKRVVFSVPSLSLHDGEYANNSWLQELPDPVTKIVWDNAALMSPATAVAIGAATGTTPKELAKASEHVVTVTTDKGSVDLPVWVQVGMADDVVAVSLGYGRTSGGSIANNVGANAYRLPANGHASAYTSLKNIAINPNKSHRVATTQNHHTLSDGRGDRPVAHFLTADDVKNEKFEKLHEEFPNTGKEGHFLKPLSIVSDYQYHGHRWGMVIDMSACTGCSSCVIACQSENNIPSVGKEQVLIGREMHWIRLDRYYTGDMENPMTLNEPMLCQHCENAPCENVCPVAATTHSPEGLNEMTYNRCVGTRYCLNNCPYKVRRFNFLDYADKHEKSPLDLVFNPEVSSRMRGMMEKCTFCVQRLHEAKWKARDAGHERVPDGQAVTACQEACPAGAIYFGDTNDQNSWVSKMRMEERGFRVLSDLNVRPQVTYLADVRNS